MRSPAVGTRHQQARERQGEAGDDHLGRKAMFQMFGVFSEFEHAIIRERAKAQGKRFGRPKVSAAIEVKIKSMLKQGVGMVKIGRQLGCGTATVQRVRDQGA